MVGTVVYEWCQQTNVLNKKQKKTDKTQKKTECNVTGGTKKYISTVSKRHTHPPIYSSIHPLVDRSTDHHFIRHH